MGRWINWLYYTSFSLNVLLVLWLVSGKALELPLPLQVVGRLHPLLLHFPIVLVILTGIRELFFREGGGVGEVFLPVTACTAAISAITGLFLSQESGYDPDAIFWHKWTGAGLSWILIIWLAFRRGVFAQKFGLWLAGAGSIALAIMAGHQGAGITHGEDFLTAPLAHAKEELTRSKGEESLIYSDLVAPLLQRKCMSCHNDQKAKGGLKMSSPEQLKKGGEHGVLWDLSHPDLGLMMKRLLLPLEHKEHMPPAGKPQLTPDELDLIRFWIKSGPVWDKKVVQLEESDSLIMIARKFISEKEEEVYAFPAADKSQVDQLNNNYRVIAPIALGSPALKVDFFSANQFQQGNLAELLPLKKQIVFLNLNKMPVRDEDLKIIGQFSELRKLNLSFTQITGATLSELSKCVHLSQLSLSGIALQEHQLNWLKPLPSLRSLILWNTGLPDLALERLQKDAPNLKIEKGFNGDTIKAQLSLPILENEEISVFTNQITIGLKHYVKDAAIRYTLDGSDPAPESQVYSEPIVLSNSATLKAVAFLDGWESSDTLVKQFYKTGMVPDSAWFLKMPDPQYHGSPKTLYNGKLGDSNFRSGKWLGYRDQPFEMMVSFNQPTDVSSVAFNYLVLTGSYIMPPVELQVWAGDHPGNLKLMATQKPAQPGKDLPERVESAVCQFPAKKVKMLKLVGRPVSRLPQWHPGKGDKGWFFTDEIFIR